MPILRGINSDLNFELLDRINGRERDVRIEVHVHVLDAVESVVIVKNALAPGGYCLLGAIATLAGSRLPGHRRKHVGVWRKGNQVQVLATVQREFSYNLVLDHRSQRCRLGLQQARRGIHFHSLIGLAHLKHHVKAHRLLHLNLEPVAQRRLEARHFSLQRVSAWWD